MREEFEPLHEEEGTLVSVNLHELGGSSIGDGCLACIHEDVCHRVRALRQHFYGITVMFICSSYVHDDSFSKDDDTDE